MEFTSLLDTSLNLNSKPRRVVEEPPPQPPKQEAESKLIEFGSRNATKTIQEERGALLEELSRASAENKKLTEMLSVMYENYSELKDQLAKYTSKNPRKRKVESSINNYNNNNNNAVAMSESISSDEDSSKKPSEEEIIKAKISRVQVRNEASDASLVVKDGYQWRKYGQKVTRDNPSPRAYFKCSFAPTCPVKKKVQRSVEDQTIVVATYEGEHNHPHPSKGEGSSPPVNWGSTPGKAPCSPTITLDLTKASGQEAMTSARGKSEAPHLQHYLLEQMASTLTRDPSFKAALAAAISGKFLQKNNQTDKG